MISFRTDLAVADSMVFENIYEPELRLDIAEKRLLLDRGAVLWMFCGGALIGETYGVPLAALDEKIEDCDPSEDAIYCYSTTLLPAGQRRGLGTLMKAYWLGMTHPTTVVGHATSAAAWALNRKFGAEEMARHANWYGTSREAIFYRLRRK